MSESLAIRGINPIWSAPDLTGNFMDDTFWFYVLSNEVPYIPETVWHDPSRLTPWTNPIQVLANGSLPENIYFDENKTYRLEWRRNFQNLTPPSQADELIYVVENYAPNGEIIAPLPQAVTSGNQITNPQFPLISFNGARTISTAGEYLVAPGWTLVLTGTGTAIVSRVSLNATDDMPPSTNAPYALRANMSAWTGEAYLRQRFNQTGVLFRGSNITAQLAARLTSGTDLSLTGEIRLSSGLPVAELWFNQQLANAEFVHFIEQVGLPNWTSIDTPPTAFVELRINLPRSSVDITSVGLSAGFIEGFEQESVERQIDHTFHNYYNSILIQPKQSLAVGWNFALNPWQFHPYSITDLSGNGGYTADQTIVITENTNSVQVGPTSNPAHRLDIRSKVGTAQGRVAVIQYIDHKSIDAYWGYIMSSLVRARITTTQGSQVGVKMCLIHSDIAPAAVNPIQSWNADGPVFTAQWTRVNPVNDPTYTLLNATDPLQGGGAGSPMAFNGFALPSKPYGTATLGIVFYTTAPMSSAAIDQLLINSISLVPNEFAIDASPQTFDECLRQCQFYYEKSYPLNGVPGVATTAVGALHFSQPARHDTGTPTHDRAYRFPFQIDWQQFKRTTPNITLYAPGAGTANRIQVGLLSGTTRVTVTSPPNPVSIVAVNDPGWTLSSNSPYRAHFVNNNVGVVLTGVAAGSQADQQDILVHYVADARLGIVT
jgi:hypothetical protein